MGYDSKSIQDWQDEVHATARAKGFYDAPPSVPEKLALIHSEVSEALEAYRDDELAMRVEPSGKPEGLVVELADVVIRVLDLCAALDLSLEDAMRAKAAFNATRPHKHGRKRL